MAQLPLGRLASPLVEVTGERKQTDPATSIVTTYTWNHFNRLASITTSDNSKKQSHTFGANGFRRKKKDKDDVETTDSSSITETRTYNDLNQLTQNVIDDGTTPVTWTYTHDTNGNMTSKTDGTDTYTYVWNVDNQLKKVELNGSIPFFMH